MRESVKKNSGEHINALKAKHNAKANEGFSFMEFEPLTPDAQKSLVEIKKQLDVSPLGLPRFMV